MNFKNYIEEVIDGPKPFMLRKAIQQPDLIKTVSLILAYKQHTNIFMQ